MQCISDESGADRIRATVDAANRDFHVTGTPTFILNGTRYEGPPTYEAMSHAIDAAIAG